MLLALSSPQPHEFRSIILQNSLYWGSPEALNLESAIKASYVLKGISRQLSWVPQGLGVSQHSTKTHCRDAKAFTHGTASFTARC